MSDTQQKTLSKKEDVCGLTLMEMLIAMAIMAVVAVATTTLVTTCVDIQNDADAESRFYQEGMLAMERMTRMTRTCTFLLIPNAHAPLRDMLAVSGSVNDDNDFYFDDPRFPRIDEDLLGDMTADFKNGIQGIDDDGDMLIDEQAPTVKKQDDDESLVQNEDPYDGIDNDGDGNIDEDVPRDMNGDGFSGIAGMDDDGDGEIDEEDEQDDDEDGDKNEDPLNPLIYSIDPARSMLVEVDPNAGTTNDVCGNAVGFLVKYEAPDQISLKLALMDKDGRQTVIHENVCARNVFQRSGKRVR